MYFFHFVWGTHSWYLSKYFRYTLCILLLMPGTTFHTHTKQQAKFYLSLPQYSRSWIAKCSHQIYNILTSKHTPKFLFLVIVALLVIFHNDLTVPYFGETSYLSSHYNFALHSVNKTYHTGILKFICVYFYTPNVLLTPKIFIFSRTFKVRY